jgi:hypothetical protein
VALAAAAVVLIWGLVHTVREVFFHGFAPNCSDGHPEYDARYCELPGGPASLLVAAAVVVVVLALVVLGVARRRADRAGLAGADTVDATQA